MTFRTPDEMERICVNKDETVQEAVTRLDREGFGVICIIDEKGCLQGIMTNGDFRKYILTEGKLSAPVTEAMNAHPVVVTESENMMDQIHHAFMDPGIRSLPIIDRNGKLVDVVFLYDVHRELPRQEVTPLPEHCQVVVMAGGKGTRLEPFTRILPKPLLPVGEKPIIEIIMDRFHAHGVHRFWISVNHKAKMVRAYFEEQSQPWDIRFLEEDKPLGTIGALYQLKSQIEHPFFVTNCDIVVLADYGKMYEYHMKHEYDMTLVTSAMQYTIPYGVCELRNGGELERIVEKPRIDLLVNTGLYILNPDVLSLLPEHEYFDTTDLIQRLLETNRRIGLYPVPQQSWLDVGQWEEYRKTVKRLENILSFET